MHDTISLAEKALAAALGTAASGTAAFDGARLVDPVDLGGSARSRVLRCRVELHDEQHGDQPDEQHSERTSADKQIPATVIVKHFLSDAGGFVRESAGLELCSRTPSLLAQDRDHRLIVMSDLGDLPTLADLLLGDDHDAAWEGARTWARALGRATGDSRDQVARARRRLADAEPWNADADLRNGVDRLLEAVTAGGAGSGTRAAIESELAATQHLRTPGTAAIVSPTDTCPDNAVLGPDGWWFLDLEGTDVEHAAFAAAYAVLPFATCWCVFDPPAGLTDMLFTEFSAGLAVRAPDVVAEPGWDLAVRQACAVYLVLMTGWLWKSTLEGRPFVGPEGRSPSYRQLMVSRWRWGALNLRQDFPALAAAMGDAATWALESWGPGVEPTGYRAFR
ncbi:hypothetical protein C8K30_10399 [Promicromonospora sp. AC04]|uniref:hypothetical protein n=1 Tax=Promicromonospora sp. AC04 TaxID=2135723 RepID=UPI000D34B386|nr:hypothetical protein [Promicromonospora sp. AC04]PUB28679.1 hypothetical protein C8K30_10399 [Promicromonospora sp. AC04]